MSTETKATHTPGPWEVVRHQHVDGELWLSVNQHADAHGMKEWVAEIKYLVTDPERQMANARLIAAAPELLELVRYVYDTLATRAPLYNTDKLHRRLCDVLGRIDGETG